jgi:hypothetical protein
MNANAVLSRATASWGLAFVHASKTLHFLNRALLLSAASVALGLAWLFCWLDRFGSLKASTKWLIYPFPAAASEPVGRSVERPEMRANMRPDVRPVMRQPVALGERRQAAPRTIDSLIRNREARF